MADPRLVLEWRELADSVFYYLSNTGQLTNFKAIKNPLKLQKRCIYTYGKIN
jgi:predicted AAA+ superfamily ATPase